MYPQHPIVREFLVQLDSLTELIRSWPDFKQHARTTMPQSGSEFIKLCQDIERKLNALFIQIHREPGDEREREILAHSCIQAAVRKLFEPPLCNVKISIEMLLTFLRRFSQSPKVIRDVTTVWQHKLILIVNILL